MSQQKIDELFASSKARRSSRNKHDEFDDIFESHTSNKRRRVNQQQSDDVFDFPVPSLSSSSLKKKRSAAILDDEENQAAIDQLFNSNDTRKKLRRSMKTEPTLDVFDMFSTPSTGKKTTTKKIDMFFDPTDLETVCEVNELVGINRSL